MCETGFYDLTSFGCESECFCDPTGSGGSTGCDIISGQCTCMKGYVGKKCDLCRSGYWRSDGKCVECDCNLNGVLNQYDICDQVIWF